MNNDSITIIVTSGDAPYFFSKDSGVNFVQHASPMVYTNLAPGLYYIAVKDKDTTAYYPETVDSASLISITTNAISPVCDTTKRGSISVSVTGGVKPYTYEWFNEFGIRLIGQDSSVIDSLRHGKYVVVVTDSMGCPKQKTDSIQRKWLRIHDLTFSAFIVFEWLTQRLY